MKKTICLSTAYLAPVSYYVELMRAERVVVEQHEHYLKQTYRNRAQIATANGVMPLSIPVEHHGGEKVLIKDLKMSNHGNWCHLHWQALKTAYDKSPYFEYYEDDFRPFYESQPTEYLFDFNLRLQEMICRLINLDVNLVLSESYEKEGDFVDLRNAFSPKQKVEDPRLQERYYQVFMQKIGFQPDLSIVDLLFNMGPEALIVLDRSLKK